MKYYDKQGGTHKSMIGALGANITNKFKGTKVGDKIEQTTRRAEDAIDEMIDNQNPYSKDEITVIVSSMMHQLDEPIKCLLKGNLNSEIGEMKFLEMVFGVFGVELYENPVRFEKSYPELAHEFADSLAKLISVKAKENKSDSLG